MRGREEKNEGKEEALGLAGGEGERIRGRRKEDE